MEDFCHIMALALLRQVGQAQNNLGHYFNSKRIAWLWDICNTMEKGWWWVWDIHENCSEIICPSDVWNMFQVQAPGSNLCDSSKDTENPPTPLLQNVLESNWKYYWSMGHQQLQPVRHCLEGGISLSCAEVLLQPNSSQTTSDTPAVWVCKTVVLAMHITLAPASVHISLICSHLGSCPHTYEFICWSIPLKSILAEWHQFLSDYLSSERFLDLDSCLCCFLSEKSS